VYVEDAAGLAPELLRILERKGAAPKALSIKQPIPEDVYPLAARSPTYSSMPPLSG
jgi:hypothetical protein